MSNSRIAGQLSALADEVELGQVSVSQFADQLLGYTEALERMPYSRIKEAQMVRAQLNAAIERGEAKRIDLHRLGDWLRDWVAKVPIGPA
jgi:hypothetical protein